MRRRSGAAWNGRIVVVGGLTEDGQASGRADRYNPDDNVWSPLPDLPLPLHHTAVVVVDDRVWVLGGFTAFEGDIFVPTRTVFSLGEGEDRWREEPVELRALRGAHGAATNGEHSIVVAGGVDGDGQVIALVDRVCTGCGAAGEGPALAEPREHFALVGVGGDIYAIGGRVGGAATNKTSVEVLPEGGLAWESGPRLGVARGGTAAAVVDGRPCVAGGETPEVTIAEVECLNDGRWEVVARLATPRHGVAVVGLGDILHVIGGGPEPGLTVSGVHQVFELPRP